MRRRSVSGNGADIESLAAGVDRDVAVVSSAWGRLTWCQRPGAAARSVASKSVREIGPMQGSVTPASR